MMRFSITRYLKKALIPLMILAWLVMVVEQGRTSAGESPMPLPERFRGEVVMPHDDNNEHACTGCTACELACPNATIKIITKFEMTPEGKKKKALDTFVYHLELCTFCNLCIEACPTDAIKMAQTFEHSVFDRTNLTKILNNPGSKIREGIE